MKLSILQCLIIIGLMAIPARLSFTTPGLVFWEAVAWEWQTVFSVIGLCTPPEKDSLELAQPGSGWHEVLVASGVVLSGMVQFAMVAPLVPLGIMGFLRLWGWAGPREESEADTTEPTYESDAISLLDVLARRLEEDLANLALDIAEQDGRTVVTSVDVENALRARMGPAAQEILCDDEIEA